jgi:hypothetical protein
MDYQITFTDTAKAPFIVKPYTANGPKEPGSPTPLYSSAVSANTSLTILGKGAFDYGEPIQKNFIHLLENFANKTRPAYPIQGQLWYKNESVGDPNWPGDPASKGLYVYTGTVWTQIFTNGVPLISQLDAGTFKIINVGNAVDDTDALNLRTGDARYVNITGDSMNGTLNMSTNRVSNVGDAVEPFDAVNRSYGDGRYVRSAGSQMMGTLDLNNNALTNVKDAVNPQDALNLRTARSIFVTAGVGGSVDGGEY